MPLVKRALGPREAPPVFLPRGVSVRELALNRTQFAFRINLSDISACETDLAA